MWFGALLFGLVVAAGCKPDPEPASQTPSGQEPAHAKRSGKIDVPRPTLADPRSRTADPQREERREERRQRRDERMDTDDDGEVSPEERKEDRRQRAITMHDRLDRDRDGKLSPAELGDTKIGRRFNVASIDLNHDGDVSPDELVTAMETYIPPPRQKRGRE